VQATHFREQGGALAISNVTVLKGKLHYIQNETRLGPCPCEPAYDPPLNALLAIASGTPDDLSAATSYLQNLGWTEGACVEVQGAFAMIGVNVPAFYLQQITNCPIGPCNG
jgi:hypothetical protein